jgi:hypothetical protein
LKAILARAKQEEWGREISPWVDLFDRCARSKFLLSGSWFGLDWIVKRKNFEKILAGNYDDGGGNGRTPVEQDGLSDSEAARYDELG